jgi:hypothetical protein
MSGLTRNFSGWLIKKIKHIKRTRMNNGNATNTRLNKLAALLLLIFISIHCCPK